jgi:hypothetical protein
MKQHSVFITRITFQEILLAIIISFAAPAVEGVTFTTDTYISGSNMSYEGQDIIVDRCTLTVDSAHSFNSLQVKNGGIVTHSPLCSPILHLTIAHDVSIDIQSRIDVSGKGYGSAAGPGKGGNGTSYGAGGGYGGLGGNSRNNNAIGGSTYGSITEPVLLGSGGGTGGSSVGAAGGGAIRLTVEGTLNIEGQIMANGADDPSPYGGGGSGGSIYLTVINLTGAGAIMANGGEGYYGGGGGGGGRIAICCHFNNFIGTISTNGGQGANWGQNGSIYYYEPAQCRFGCGDAFHPYPIGDLSRDCIVNFLDLAIMAEHWLEQS